jgi:hypothetical protein
MSESFDSLLARTEHRNTAPPDQCPGSDVLAAYLDATLAPSERAAVEAHAADCSRCALQLGTMVRLEDESGYPQQAPRQGWWPRLAWIVPAATAVLVAAVYVARPTEVRPPPNPAALGNRVAAAPTDTAAPPAEFERAAPPPTAPGADSAPVPARKAAPPSLKTAPAVAETPSMDTLRAEQKVAEPVLEQDQFADRTPAPAAPAPAAPAAAALARREARTHASAAASSMLSTSPGFLVRSPDRRVLWRITGTGIERSADGGSTWMAEHAPAAGHITVGAAPSGQVCWLATESGKVLRRNEAGTWRDVSPFPGAPIARIESTTVLEATVVHADGTTLTTVDGGRTWIH